MVYCPNCDADVPPLHRHMTEPDLSGLRIQQYTRLQFVFAVALPETHQHSMNARLAPRLRNAIFQQHKQDAANEIRRALNGAAAPRYHMARALVRFELPDRQVRDGDNLIASLKAVWDALVETSVLQSDDVWHLRHVDYRFTLNRDRPAGGVFITVIPLDDEPGHGEQECLLRKQRNKAAGLKRSARAKEKKAKASASAGATNGRMLAANSSTTSSRMAGWPMRWRSTRK